MTSSIALKNIQKQYKSGFSLNIDNLKFFNEGIYVIVGPNGCGKSTVLNLIGLLDKPDEGTILIDEKEMACANNNHSKLRKKIGFLKQKPYLFNMNVFDNVALGLKIRNYPIGEINSKVNNILTKLGIAHLGKRKIKALSGGEAQRVAIAQVLVLEPEIILLDEPIANVDAQSTFSIEEVLKNIQKQTKSIVIMTTHSLEQAYRMSKDIISMSEGKIVDFIHENVFSGEIKLSAGDLQYMDIGRKKKIIFSTEKTGKTFIAIDPEDVVVSKTSAKTSARNTFKGKITKMESLGANIRLLIDTGIPIYSIITKQSFQEMGINLASEVYVNFKVNSVKVI